MHQLTIDHYSESVSITDHADFGDAHRALLKYVVGADYYLRTVQNTAAHTSYELVFEQLNIDSPECAWALRYRGARHRSLSVGDVVVIGEAPWACCAAGWKRITTDDLHAALDT
jgi:hypothetical protein